jgi:hypothetical protein
VEGVFGPDNTDPDDDPTFKKNVLDIIKYLIIDMGANVHVKNQATNNNLLYTVVDGRNNVKNRDVIKLYNYLICLLLRMEVSIVSDNRKNPLSITNSYKLAKILLLKLSSEDLNKRDFFGHTPLFYQFQYRSSTDEIRIKNTQKIIVAMRMFGARKWSKVKYLNKT